MDALFNSLKTLLVDKLRKTKGRFDEEELRAVFAEHGMDVPSANALLARCWSHVQKRDAV